MPSLRLQPHPSLRALKPPPRCLQPGAFKVSQAPHGRGPGAPRPSSTPSAEQHPLSPPSSSPFLLSKPQPARPPHPLPRLGPWICSTTLPQTRAARDPLGLPRPRVPGPRYPPRSRRQACVSDDWAFTAAPSGPYNPRPPPPAMSWVGGSPGAIPFPASTYSPRGGSLP